jgi:uncharacterized membrane protein
VHPDLESLVMGWLTASQAGEVLGAFFRLRLAWPQADVRARQQFSESALAAIMADVPLARVKFEQLQQLAH